LQQTTYLGLTLLFVIIIVIITLATHHYNGWSTMGPGLAALAPLL